MKTNIKRILALALAAACLFTFAACGSSAPAATTAAPAAAPEATAAAAAETPAAAEAKDTLRIRIPDAFSTLDPMGWSLDTDATLCNQVYEPLIRIDDDTNIIPVLATGYEFSEDGMSCVFTLRDGVTFSNGDPMLASDVKFSIERAQNSAYLSGNVSMIGSVEADNDANTVTVFMPAPAPDLLEGITFIHIVSEKFVNENVDENGALGYKTCGTGPYVLSDVEQDVKVCFTANPTYWGEAAKIPNLEFVLIVDDFTALNAFKGGSIDISRFASTSWPEIVSDPNYNTAELATNHVTYFIFNINAEPFNNENLRKAVACAMDRDAMCLFVMEGLAAPTYTVCTPLMTGYAEIQPECTYDLAAAKDYLAKAGYPDGLDIGTIETLAGTYFESAALVLKDQLAAIGITSEVVALEANTLIEHGMTGNFTMLTLGQTNTNDMSWIESYYGASYLGSLNMAGYTTEEMEAKLLAARTCMDPVARVAMYKEILEMADAATAYLPIFNKTLCIAWDANLDYTPSIRRECYAPASWN